MPILSRDSRSLAIERGILGLYRWYTEQSQRQRNWHADTCIDWRSVRRDHHDAVYTIIEGFFAVEQYTPDYVGPLLMLIRKSYGRSQWHIRWGAEEQRHADVWRNAVLTLGRRDENWLDWYTELLRSKDWRLPWDSPRHMVFYQVIQERATQVVYTNLRLALSGKLPRLETASDPALAQACRLIAADEAAHYHFFLQVARLLLYYEPEQSIDALIEVLRFFSMPARELVPDYATFGEVLHRHGLFGRAIHYRDVVEVVLRALSLPPAKLMFRQSGESPASKLDINNLERQVRLLYSRNDSHLNHAGLAHVVFNEWRRPDAFAELSI